MTSYSGLSQQGGGHHYEIVPRFDTDAAGERRGVSEVLPEKTPHTFPKGAAPGTFLHGLFESFDFTEGPDRLWLQEQVERQGLVPEWEPVVYDWLEAVLKAPLTEEGVRLCDIPTKERSVELQFFLPIDSPLTAARLDALAKRYDPLSAGCPALAFRQVEGMLKGFIDLVFRWQGRYYLLDYKSNWLGEDASAYTQEAMATAMGEHRYDLQYQLYTLALHRYLRHRIADYDYQTHFGGVLYLFLRGVEPGKPQQGIFHCRPELALVEAMDALFHSGEMPR